MASFDHCVIAVSDWARSNAFYADVLGAEVVQVGEGYAYRFGPNQLNVHGPGMDGEPNAAPPVAPGGADLCFVWDGSIEEAGSISHASACRSSWGPCRGSAPAARGRACISATRTGRCSS